MSKKVKFATVMFILLLFSVPFVFVGAMVGGLKGMGVGWAFTVIGMIFAATCSEKSLVKAYRAKLPVPEGLKRSLALVVGPHSPSPRLFLFPETSASIFTVRALGGGGSLFVSQGLVSLLNEDELRAVLKMCLLRLSDPSHVFQSFCSQMMIWTLSMAPRFWVDVIFGDRPLSKKEECSLNPVSAIGFLMLFPLAQFFNILAKPSMLNEKNANFGEAYPIAIQKIGRAICTPGPWTFWPHR